MIWHIICKRKQQISFISIMHCRCRCINDWMTFKLLNRFIESSYVNQNSIFAFAFFLAFCIRTTFTTFLYMTCIDTASQLDHVVLCHVSSIVFVLNGKIMVNNKHECIIIINSTTSQPPMCALLKWALANSVLSLMIFQCARYLDPNKKHKL